MDIIDECSNGFDDFGNCNSNWDRWGRWVAVGCLIAAAIILFFLLA
jgi:hypothetical protein